METTLLVALIASVTSVTVAFFTFFYTRANQRDVEHLKANFAEEKSEKDARRDYEYDARKRLYQECEPLFFQLAERAEIALFQIQSLAQRCKEGNLGDEGYLSKPRYYLKSTVYNLLTPLAIYKLIYSRLTLVDLQVDAKIRMQYTLVKLLYLTFTRDATIAAIKPPLKYNPYDSGWRELRKIEPQTYYRQGFPVGRLDNALDSLIKNNDKGVSSIINFGGFEKVFETIEQKDVESSLGVARDMFFLFHPEKRPVLWRLLICHAHLYECILYIKNQKEFDSEQFNSFFNNLFSNKKEKQKYDWKSKDDDFEKKILEESFQVARQFLNSFIQSS